MSGLLSAVPVSAAFRPARFHCPVSFAKRPPHVFTHPRDAGFRIYHLHEFHPWRGGRNPAFDAISKSILWLKDGRAAAIARFAQELDRYIGAEATIAIVPSHDPRNSCPPLKTLVARHLCGQSWGLGAVGVFLNFLLRRRARSGRIDATGALIRHKLIDKISRGDNRSVEVHLNSLAVKDARAVADRDVLLIDGVTTLGNALLAGAAKLSAAGARTVHALAIARTK